MQSTFGLSPDEGIPMWVADMDFRPPEVVQEALERMVRHGIYGYYGEEGSYVEAIQWWMENRHGWKVEARDILTTNGLVNATGLCVDAFTAPGDRVVLTTPVYHAFARVIRAAQREVAEMPLRIEDGRYLLDTSGWHSLMTGREKIFILCSPHNPGGRVWSRDELRAVADFCRRYDLILVSDEIHHDLIMPGYVHTPTAVAAPEIVNRLITLSSTTKTFNIAGAHIGNVIISDDALRQRFNQRITALGISGNSFGYHMAEAAYSREGAAWVDELCRYLAGNAKLFDEGFATIQGVRSMKLEATYLAWVDFSEITRAPDEIAKIICGDAKIAANKGPTFGLGGETYMRFNVATTRSLVGEAVERIRGALEARSDRSNKV